MNEPYVHYYWWSGARHWIFDLLEGTFTMYEPISYLPKIDPQMKDCECFIPFKPVPKVRLKKCGYVRQYTLDIARRGWLHKDVIKQLDFVPIPESLWTPIYTQYMLNQL